MNTRFLKKLNPELFVFDLDGVIYRGNKVLPGAKQILKALRNRPVKIFFLTNNSSRTREQYVFKMRSMGIICHKHEVMTSAYATALWLKEKDEKVSRILVMGGHGLLKELRTGGFHAMFAPASGHFSHVVVGLDSSFSYQKLASAQKAILSGARFIATNMDSTYPAERGVLPGGGSLVEAVRYCTMKKPFVVGKPKTYSVKKILQLAGVKPEQTVLVGDRLETDIAAGRKAGLKTVLVTTGISKHSSSNFKIKPHVVVKSLKELSEQL